MTEVDEAIEHAFETVILYGRFSVRQLQLEEPELSSVIEVLREMQSYEWLQVCPDDEVTWSPGPKIEQLLRLRTGEEDLDQRWPPQVLNY